MKFSQSSITIQFHLLQLLLYVKFQLLGAQQFANEHSLPHLVSLADIELLEGRRDQVIVEDDKGNQLFKVEHQLVDELLSVD